MDLFGLVQALVVWFQANWPAIEVLSRRLAEDLAALYVLAVGLAAVLAPFLGFLRLKKASEKAAAAKAKLLGVLNK